MGYFLSAGMSSMEENEILFEPNKKSQQIMKGSCSRDVTQRRKKFYSSQIKNHSRSWGFSDHEMAHREGRNFIWLK